MKEQRPAYETVADAWNERKVAEHVARKWSCDFEKMPVAYPVDYGFVRDDKLLFIAEIKCRTIPRKKYPTYMISAKKVADARSIASTLSVPALLVVRWSCGSIRWINMNTDPVSVRWGGRADRDDSNDKEPCIFWHVNSFIKVRDLGR
jgi:hypothetical protein